MTAATREMAEVGDSRRSRRVVFPYPDGPTRTTLRTVDGSLAANTGERPFARGPASALTAIEDHLRNTAWTPVNRAGVVQVARHHPLLRAPPQGRIARGRAHGVGS